MGKHKLCPCGRRRTLCRIHGGGSYCSRGVRRTDCKMHGGGSLCLCGLKRHLCKVCTNFTCTVEGCKSFGRRYAGAKGLRNHVLRCHSKTPSPAKAPLGSHARVARVKVKKQTVANVPPQVLGTAPAPHIPKIGFLGYRVFTASLSRP